jgi:hypothetical protein
LSERLGLKPKAEIEKPKAKSQWHNSMQAVREIVPQFKRF